MAKHDRKGRGSSYDRRRRRAWLVSKYRVSPAMVECFHCHQRMRANGGKWEVDRYPIAGKDGGSYRRDNIVIACERCNRGHNTKLAPRKRLPGKLHSTMASLF